MHASLTDLHVRDPLIANLRDIIRQLEEAGIENRELLLDDDNFLEILINHIRNEVINYQAFTFKKIDESTSHLAEKIKQLKNEHLVNFDRISELELQLRQINETKINSELEKNPNFALLNSERITPFFLKMAKGSVQESSLDVVCDEDGRPTTHTSKGNLFIIILLALLRKIR
jgi:predicted nuclease with TOPRIM domain